MGGGHCVKSVKSCFPKTWPQQADLCLGSFANLGSVLTSALGTQSPGTVPCVGRTRQLFTQCCQGQLRAALCCGCRSTPTLRQGVNWTVNGLVTGFYFYESAFPYDWFV